MQTMSHLDPLPMYAPGSERVSDEELIAAVLFHAISSGCSEPLPADFRRAVSNVRDRLQLLRRCLLSPIGREIAAASRVDEVHWRREYTGTFDLGPRSYHGDALLEHLRENDGPTHNLD